MPVVHVLHKARWEFLIKEARKTPHVCSCIIKPLVNKLNAGSSVLIPVYISVLSLEQRNWLKTGLKTKTASFPSDVISGVTQSPALLMPLFLPALGRHRLLLHPLASFAAWD